MIRIFISIILLLPACLIAQVKDAYSIFNYEGKSASYRKMIRSLSEADVVFFGEVHNNTLAHWLELQILKDLYQSNNNLDLGMEMFEADDQIILDEYLADFIEEKQFLNESKVWDNYKTDYKPLIEFARQKKLRVIATNVPRRYANLVYRKGLHALDSLSAESEKWIASLPLSVDHSSPGYKAMMENMGGHGPGTPENLVASQALKDATMASFIFKHQKMGNLFLHINGAYHTQDKQGIISYLKMQKPDLEILTLHVAEQTAIADLDKSNQNKADFIICITEDMIRSY